MRSDFLCNTQSFRKCALCMLFKEYIYRHFVHLFSDDMEVTLLRANIDDAKELHAMQVEAFKK